MVITIDDIEIELHDYFNNYLIKGPLTKGGYQYRCNFYGKYSWVGIIYLDLDFKFINAVMNVDYIEAPESYGLISRPFFDKLILFGDIKPVYEERGLVWSLK